MEISNNILELIEGGYAQHCDSISLLVYERLNVPADEIFSRLFKEHRSVVNAYCDKYGIDLASVLEANEVEVKQSIGWEQREKVGFQDKRSPSLRKILKSSCFARQNINHNLKRRILR